MSTPRPDGGMTRVMLNSSMLVMGRLLAKLGTTILLVVVARVLGDEGFGVYSGLIAWGAMWSILVELGQTIPMIRRIAGEPSPLGAHLGPVLMLKGVLSVPAILGFVFTGVFFGWPMFVLALMGATMALESINTTLQRSVEGLEAMGTVAGVTILDRVLYLGMGTGALFISGTLEGLAIGLLLASATSSAAVLTILAKRHGWPTFQLSNSTARALFHESRPFIVAAVLSVVYARVDVMLLTSLTNASVVGQFGVASRFVEAWTFIPLAVITSVFPKIVQYGRLGNADALHRFIGHSVRLLLPIALGIAVIMAATASWLLPRLFSDQFIGAVRPAQIMSVYLCCMGLNALFGNVLIALGREALSTWMLGVGAVLSMAFNAVLIPIWGADGASAARSTVELLLLAPQVWLVFRTVRTLEEARADSNLSEAS